MWRRSRTCGAIKAAALRMALTELRRLVAKAGTAVDPARNYASRLRVTWLAPWLAVPILTDSARVPRGAATPAANACCVWLSAMGAFLMFVIVGRNPDRSQGRYLYGWDWSR